MSQQVINETPDRRKHAARRRVHQREDISRARPLRQHTRSTLVSRERPLLVLGVRRYGCDVSAPEVSCANRSRRAWASAESAASEFQDSSSSIACAGVIPLATRLTTCATEMRRPRIVARPGNNSSLCASARTSSPCTSSMIVRRRLTEWFKFRLEWRRRDPCPLPRGTLSRAFSDRNEAAVVGESSGPAARRSRRLQHVSTNRVDLRAIEGTRADRRKRSNRQHVNRLRPQLAYRQRVEKLPKNRQFRVRLPPPPLDSPCCSPSANRKVRSWRATRRSSVLSERSESKGCSTSVEPTV